MAAKGSIAKEEVTKMIQDVFGENFLGEFDKKIYVQVPENGEMVQIAIALTCPKTPVTISSGPVVKGDRMDFDSEPVVSAPIVKAEITAEERENIAAMMARLGL